MRISPFSLNVLFVTATGGVLALACSTHRRELSGGDASVPSDAATRVESGAYDSGWAAFIGATCAGDSNCGPGMVCTGWKKVNCSPNVAMGPGCNGNCYPKGGAACPKFPLGGPDQSLCGGAENQLGAVSKPEETCCAALGKAGAYLCVQPDDPACGATPR
jgi:hypothetical protein